MLALVVSGRERKDNNVLNILPLTNQARQENMMYPLNQLTRPVILIGNFNAHNPLWGSEKKQPHEGKREKKI